MDKKNEPSRDYPSGLKEWAELEKMRREIRAFAGRFGMLERDFDKFVPHPPRRWTKRELKNRIAWLREQRGQLLGSDKTEEIAGNGSKLAMYTRELFRRESAKNQQKERDEYNAMRRWKRAVAKQKRRKALVDKWLKERKAKRKSMKNKNSSKPQK